MYYSVDFYSWVSINLLLNNPALYTNIFFYLLFTYSFTLVLNSYLDYDREWTNPTLHSLELRICTESVQCAED